MIIIVLHCMKFHANRRYIHSKLFSFLEWITCWKHRVPNHFLVKRAIQQPWWKFMDLPWLENIPIYFLSACIIQKTTWNMNFLFNLSESIVAIFRSLSHIVPSLKIIRSCDIKGWNAISSRFRETNRNGQMIFDFVSSFTCHPWTR